MSELFYVNNSDQNIIANPQLKYIFHFILTAGCFGSMGDSIYLQFMHVFWYLARISFKSMNNLCNTASKLKKWYSSLPWQQTGGSCIVWKDIEDKWWEQSACSKWIWADDGFCFLWKDLLINSLWLWWATAIAKVSCLWEGVSAIVWRAVLVYNETINE